MSAPGEVGCEAEFDGGFDTSFDSGYPSASWLSFEAPSNLFDFVFPSPSPRPNLDLTPPGLVGFVWKGGGAEESELDLELDDEEGEDAEEGVVPRVASHMARS